MKNPLMVVPGFYAALEPAIKASKSGPVPSKTLHLVRLRASQINSCAFCVDMHVKEALHDGDTNERLHMVASWREARSFTPAERAALALTEAITRCADVTGEAVSDELWADATKHYDEAALGFLLLNIALINFFNRTNVPVRTVAGPTVSLPDSVGKPTA